MVVAAIACLALCARAQTSPLTRPATLEVAVAYSADRTNGLVGGCGCFWMQGGKAEASANFKDRFSVVAELAGEHAGSINSAGESLSLISYLFGPRYSLSGHSRLVPFAQFLVGGVHGFDASFPEPNGSAITPDALAFATGGGLNVNVSRYVAFRAFQADYMQTHLPNDAGNRQNHLRLAAGLILRLR
jgi:peptidoglycan-associated lipoprotein